MTCIDDYVNRIIQGDCLEVLKGIPDNSIDTVITDPPYGLKFMSKRWDYDIPDVEIFAEMLRVTKPGALLFCFGGSRTFHRLTCAIEDAGWEIRDCMMWLYGSGFPKSHAVGKAIDRTLGGEREIVAERIKLGDKKSYPQNPRQNGQIFVTQNHQAPITKPATPEAAQFEGYGTALKPAWEPIIVAMKPVDSTFANNALTWGVSGLWVDGGRVETKEDTSRPDGKCKHGKLSHSPALGESWNGNGKSGGHPEGRWPANVILDEEAARLLDEQSGIRPSGGRKGTYNGQGVFSLDPRPSQKGAPIKSPREGDSGGASRFFYCAKASKRERGDYNNHPTVKPLELVTYLARLSKTPTGGIVLDPFAGSGTTALAALKTGRQYICIEQDAHYVEIAERRVSEFDGVQLELTNA